jgi:hypothetical protein
MAATTTVFGHLIEHDAGDWYRVVTEGGITIGRIRKVRAGWQYRGPQVWPRPGALVWPSRQVAVWELICENEQAGLPA